MSLLCQDLLAKPRRGKNEYIVQSVGGHVRFYCNKILTDILDKATQASSLLEI